MNDTSKTEKGLLRELMIFLKALNESVPDDTPENRGKVIEFICPICGGTAKCVRAEYNGHIHAECTKCDIKIMQ